MLNEDTVPDTNLYDSSIEMFDSDEPLHLPQGPRYSLADQTIYAEMNRSSKAPGLLFFDGKYLKETRNIRGFEP
jgi:hypothetical protein